MEEYKLYLEKRFETDTEEMCKYQANSDEDTTLKVINNFENHLVSPFSFEDDD